MSIILVGDFAQLPLVMDKPIYASHTTARNLWHKFNTVVTLQTMFRQEGDDPIQIQFRQTLQNTHNA